MKLATQMPRKSHTVHGMPAYTRWARNLPSTSMCMCRRPVKERIERHTLIHMPLSSAHLVVVAHQHQHGGAPIAHDLRSRGQRALLYRAGLADAFAHAGRHARVRASCCSMLAASVLAWHSKQGPLVRQQSGGVLPGHAATKTELVQQTNPTGACMFWLPAAGGHANPRPTCRTWLSGSTGSTPRLSQKSPAAGSQAPGHRDTFFLRLPAVDTAARPPCLHLTAAQS